MSNEAVAEAGTRPIDKAAFADFTVAVADALEGLQATINASHADLRKDIQALTAAVDRLAKK